MAQHRTALTCKAFKSKSLAPVEAVEDAILRLQRARQPGRRTGQPGQPPSLGSLVWILKQSDPAE